MTILEFAAMAIGGYVLGRLYRGSKETRPWCKWDYWYLNSTVEPRCLQRADQRCVNGFCILHCRDKRRCGGACLKEFAEAIS